MSLAATAAAAAANDWHTTQHRRHTNGGGRRRCAEPRLDRSVRRLAPEDEMRMYAERAERRTNDLATWYKERMTHMESGTPGAKLPIGAMAYPNMQTAPCSPTPNCVLGLVLMHGVVEKTLYFAVDNWIVTAGGETVGFTALPCVVDSNDHVTVSADDDIGFRLSGNSWALMDARFDGANFFIDWRVPRCAAVQ